MAGRPLEREPTNVVELSVSGVESGYVERIRSLIKNEPVYEFAKRAGVSKSYLYDVLKGARAPSLAIFSAIAEITGVTKDWLISGGGMPNDDWKGRTALVRRLRIGTNGRPIDSGEYALVEIKSLDGTPPSKAASIRAEDDGVAPLIDIDDETLVELDPPNLINGCVYLLFENNRAIIRRFKLSSEQDPLLISGEFSSSMSNISLFDSNIHKIIARILLVSKKLKDGRYS